MSILRKVVLAAVAAGLSVALVGVSAPAQADSSWGYRTPPTSGK